MSNAAIQVTNLHRSFGKLKAVDGVSFEVAPGSVCGFIGANGAGKTTTMRTVFGLVQPDTGEVSYNGSPIDEATRLRFGYMPEERGLYPRMRVHDQLTYFGRLTGMSKSEAGDAALAWLARLGLEDRSDAKLEELSHGNQQRVQLAAAIVHDPEVLVLDEPFSGLDPIGVDSLSEVLAEFAAEGAAILFSSHQLDLVEHMCEDVAIVHGGEIVVQGDLEQIREQAGYRRVEVRINGDLWAPPVEGAHEVETAGRAHHIVPASIDVEELLALARADGVITRFSYEAPSLSDIFSEAVAE